jgi:hypothetical protein
VDLKWGQLGFGNARLSLDFGPLFLYYLCIRKPEFRRHAWATVRNRVRFNRENSRVPNLLFKLQKAMQHAHYAGAADVGVKSSQQGLIPAVLLLQETFCQVADHSGNEALGFDLSNFREVGSRK